MYSRMYMVFPIYIYSRIYMVSTCMKGIGAVECRNVQRQWH